MPLDHGPNKRADKKKAYKNFLAEIIKYFTVSCFIMPYSSILVCISNPRHGEEMARLALSVSARERKIVFLRVCGHIDDAVVREFDRDLAFMDGGPVRFEKRIVESDDPARTILDVAARENSDLIIIGSAAHKGVINRVAGSISFKLMKGSNAAVVVVRSRI